MTVEPAPKLLAVDLNAPHQKYFLASGEEVEGCTTVLREAMGQSPHLNRWFWMQGRDGASWPLREESGADLGTVVHARVHAYLTGYDGIEGVPDGLLQESDAAFLRFLARWHERGYRCLHSELQLVSERLECGGTLDIVAESDTGLVLVDLKTTKPYQGGKPYLKHRVQVGGYSVMWHENRTSLHQLDRAEIWRLGKDANDKGSIHEMVNLEAHERAFIAAAHTYREYKRCG